MSFVLREPCKRCGAESGRIEERGAQDCVYCDSGHFCYNAPRTETGKRPRTVSTTHELIRPAVRSRVLAAALGRCMLCGTASTLHVSHGLSVKDGHQLGLSDDEINSEQNLFALCEECNLGMGAQSMEARLFALMLRRRPGVMS